MVALQPGVHVPLLDDGCVHWARAHKGTVRFPGGGGGGPGLSGSELKSPARITGAVLQKGQGVHEMRNSRVFPCFTKRQPKKMNADSQNISLLVSVRKETHMVAVTTPGIENLKCRVLLW